MSDRTAKEYLLIVAKRDLQYRGMRDDRLRTFEWKQEANFLLYARVRDCAAEAEYAYLRQVWGTLNRSKHQDLVQVGTQLAQVRAKMSQVGTKLGPVGATLSPSWAKLAPR